MKIVGLVASPRENGNTDTLLQKALDGASFQGAETSIFYLNDLTIRGCQACYGCKKTGKCVVKDDMEEIYEAIDDADAVIIGSPIYFGRFTAQLALVMDRLFAYFKPDFTSSLGKGKKLALLFTQNQPDPALYSDCFQSTAEVLTRIGFSEESTLLVAAGFADPSVMEQYKGPAYELGKELAKP
jgi:multimeric flavodoxin WrbA